MASKAGFASAPRRVAVIAYTEYPADGRVRGESEVLVDQGYEVHVIAATSKSARDLAPPPGVYLSEVPITIRRGGKIRYCFQYASFFLLSSLLLATLDRKLHFDFVHVHSLPDFQVFSAMPVKLRRRPVVLDLHEALPEIVAARFRLKPTSIWVRLATVAERASCSFADHVITANDGIREAVVRRGTSDRHVTTIYNTSARTAISEPVEPAVQNWIAQPGRIVVHAGGINKERDLETLVQALALLPKNLDIHLLMAGDGEPGYVSSIIALARLLDVGDRIHYLGKLSSRDARAAMSVSYVGLVTLEDNPLTRIAWPTRIVEYARLRKPLLVPNLPFLRRKLGEAAVYYEPGDATSLAHLLELMARAPDAAAKRIELAERVCDEVGSPGAATRLVAVYHLLDGVQSS